MKKQIQRMTLIALLSAVSVLLYLVRIPMFGLFPYFLEINFSEIAMFITGFALGPIAALFTIAFRFFFSLPFSSTAFIGELADLVYSISFILPAVIYYHYHRSAKGIMIAFSLAFISQLIVTSLVNVFIVTDLYLAYFLGRFGATADDFVAIIKATNPWVQDPYWSLVLFVYLPFNTIKNIVIIGLTFLSYKRIHVFIKKIK
jgi:riboflavin transporter FmnP